MLLIESVIELNVSFLSPFAPSTFTHGHFWVW